MTRVATAWLVYELTKSALLLGVVTFAGRIPTFLLSPFAGVVVDRLNRRTLLICTQTLSMLESLALAALTLSHRITVPEILALSAFQGAVNAFDMPGRQAFMTQMVEGREDLSNAIAINSSMVNLGRLLGPALAGIVIAATSEGWCFLIDSVSYVAVITSLLMMRVHVEAIQRKAVSTLGQLREGWDYVSSFIPVRSILLLFSLLSLMGMPYVVLMPVFAGQTLHGGPHTLGFLMGASGVGALISALSLVIRKSVRGLLKMLPIAAVMLGAGLFAFGLSHWTWLSMLLMVVVGFGMMQAMTVANTIIQTLSPEEKRGRVMSYYIMTFSGMLTFGSLLDGALAHWMGAPYTVMLTGAVCVAGAVLFTMRYQRIRAHMRPVYVELGIISAQTDELAEEQTGS